MPPKDGPAVPDLTREQLLALEDDMIEAYRDPKFQQELHEAWAAAGDNAREQVRARQDTCLPAQIKVITKYGFEASVRGVNRSVAAFTKLKIEPDFHLRGEALSWLVNPEVQAKPRQLELVIGNNQYSIYEVLEDYSVGFFKRRLEEGILGSKVLYASTLVLEYECWRHVLDDELFLPTSPRRIAAIKPASVVSMLEIALKNKLGEPAWRPRMGDYIVLHSIGSGAAGVCVYEVYHIHTGQRAAVKWPAKPQEAHAMLDFAKRVPEGSYGFPVLYQYGSFEEKQYLVLELLGASLVPDLRYLHTNAPPAKRWALLRIIGRVLLQRLELLHSCGFVHCDVSPENILHGTHGSRKTLFLIDFGLAQRYPGGKPLKGDQGSAEWSSARSADGGERRPEDDVEALGWVLVQGLLGEPPWTHWLRAAYSEWNSPEKRVAVIRRVQQAKRQLVETGWEDLGSEFQVFADVPEELWQLFKSCRTLTVAPALPNYNRLHELLGATTSGEATDPEKDFEAQVLPFLRFKDGKDR